MYNIMKKLIEKHFYKTKEEAINKCDVFFAMGRLTEEEYKDLLNLIESLYN